MSQAAAIKVELQELITQENDIAILQAIRTLLQKNRLDPVWQDKLTRRAQQAERDIAVERFYSREQVVERTDSKLS